MKEKIHRERGSSEIAIIIGLVAITSLTALPNLRDKIECRMFVTQLAVADPVQTHPDGSRSVTMDIPRACVVQYLGFDPQETVRFSSWTSGRDPGFFTLTTLDGKVIHSGENQNGIFGEL